MFILILIGVLVGSTTIHFQKKDYNKSEYINYSKRQELYNQCMDKIDNHEQCWNVLNYNFKREE